MPTSYDKTNYERNKGKILARRKIYYPKWKKKYYKKYLESHREKQKDNYIRFRENNREYYNEYHRKYYQEHKEKMKEQSLACYYKSKNIQKREMKGGIKNEKSQKC
jgi:hypothetical protein